MFDQILLERNHPFEYHEDKYGRACEACWDLDELGLPKWWSTYGNRRPPSTTQMAYDPLMEAYITIMLGADPKRLRTIDHIFLNLYRNYLREVRVNGGEGLCYTRKDLEVRRHHIAYD